MSKFSSGYDAEYHLPQNDISLPVRARHNGGHWQSWDDLQGKQESVATLGHYAWPAMWAETGMSLL